MFDADQFRDVIDVVDVVLDRGGSSSVTKLRTAVTLITPPFAAMARIASSVLQRGWPGARARQLEWVISTGFVASANARSLYTAGLSANRR